VAQVYNLYVAQVKDPYQVVELREHQSGTGGPEGPAYERPRSPAQRANAENPPKPDTHETVTETNDVRSAQPRAGSAASPC